MADHDTDPSELRTSFSPNSVTLADVVSTHQAILSELQGLRLDNGSIKSSVEPLRFDSASMKSSIESLQHDVKKILETLTNLSINVTTRIEQLETKTTKLEAVIRYHHPGNGFDSIGVNEEF